MGLTVLYNSWKLLTSMEQTLLKIEMNSKIRKAKGHIC